VRVLTNSEMRCFRACPRRHLHAYIEGMRPIERPQPLRFGTLIHAALERWWKTRDLAETLHALEGEADPYDQAKATAMILGYTARWSLAGLTVAGVELEFRAPLVNPVSTYASRRYELGGKIDAIAIDDRGDTWVVEHKTTSEDITYGSPYWKRLRLDSQVSLYMVGARSLGFEPRGVLYDVLRKPAQRPLEPNKSRSIPETPEEYRARLIEAISADPERYYAQGTVVRLAAEEGEAAWDAWQTAQAIGEATRVGRHPKNPDACMLYGRPCDYFAVCTGEADIDDPHRFRRVESPHEELTAPEAAAQ
jgi:RecB family exonuclease